MEGDVPYSPLRVLNIPLLREELVFREVPYKQVLSIKALAKLLLEHDLARQKEENVEIARKLDNNMFSPLCQSPGAYEL